VESDERSEHHPVDDDEALREAQEGKGYGAGEGAREQALEESLHEDESD
jgi:hypothetical protein